MTMGRPFKTPEEKLSRGVDAYLDPKTFEEFEKIRTAMGVRSSVLLREAVKHFIEAKAVIVQNNSVHN